MNELSAFSPVTREWFTTSFPGPTEAQVGAWQAVSAGEDALVVAPTGSGKTLAAFLWALDRLATTPPPAAPIERCRVLYISPLKALAADVERNLRSPLVGMTHAAIRLGLEPPDIRVSTRTGDTPTRERVAFARAPGDVLITTPESLFLLLTSSSRTALQGVETVIVDEVHALAGTKRGAHLALSLERLDHMLPQPAQRIGLSATVRPVEEVARYLSGGRPVTVVAPEAAKAWDLRVVVPVADMAALDAAPMRGRELGTGLATDNQGALPSLDPTGQSRGGAGRTPPSIWPHVEERIADLIDEHSSTIVFANSRRLAERLTARLNEIAQQRLTGEAPDGEVHPLGPAEMIAQSGQSLGATVELARAHHGSVSKEARAEIESALKSGQLPAVVATSSLELGIDMGAVDLVVQVEAPPSVASALQRVGRAGHQVGAVSRGVFFPKYRGDLVTTTVVLEQMRRGGIEALSVPANPLDILAQQVVAMCALDDWTVSDLYALVRRSAPFATLSRGLLDAVLDMLSGRYPSDDFAELRPRIDWDRSTDLLHGRRGAQRLAVTSGGTIPDRGLFLVMLAGEGSGRRVGELDEEMVYESRVGDIFTLGTTAWRIEEITADRVLVTPAPGHAARLPFWKGENAGRPAELGQAVGRFLREVSTSTPDAARARLTETGLDELAVDNLMSYLREQADATGVVPNDTTIVIERFRDEIGDWRVVIHSPYGARVHAPWALALRARQRERHGLDIAVVHSDDGIVLRLPDTDSEDPAAGLLEDLLLEPDEVYDLVTRELSSSALFSARFRECAARALLLPRRRPDRRQPLWQQRQRSAALLQVASAHPEFPIVLEAVRECVVDVFDVPALVELLRAVRSSTVRVAEVSTPSASPFARTLLFGYVAQYLYEGDVPLAERRAAALELDAGLLAELLGDASGTQLRDLLDPDVVRRTEAELQRRAPDRQANDISGVHDLLRWLGPLTTEQITDRTEPDLRAEVTAWVDALVQRHQVVAVRVAGAAHWAAVEHVAGLRDALGVAVPPGVPGALLESRPEPLADLVRRYARTHGPFTLAELSAGTGMPHAVSRTTAEDLTRRGQLVHGALRPAELGGEDDLHYCDPEVLRVLRRRSLAALRAEVEPVPGQDYARFLLGWHGIGTPGAPGGEAAVIRAVEQLAGARLPASALESLILPARVPGYRPGLLDALTTAGEVVWQGHAELPGQDGWVSLHLAETADLTLAEPTPYEADDLHHLLLELMGSRAWFHGALATAWVAEGQLASDLPTLLWDLVWSGHLTNDTLAPLRARVGSRRAPTRPRPATTQRARWSGRAVSLAGRARSTAVLAGAPAELGGRWSRLPERSDDATLRALLSAEVMLDRYGVVSSAAARAEELPGGFSAVYRTLAAAEETGRVRRGYFVEGLGAAQFASSGAVDRLRTSAPAADLDPFAAPVPRPVVILAAADPANPYGASLTWPDTADTTHHPTRKAGALVVLRDGELLAYLERGGKSLLTFTAEAGALRQVGDALVRLVSGGAVRSLAVERVDGEPALKSTSPAVAALADAGFHLTTRGLRVRRA